MTRAVASFDALLAARFPGTFFSAVLPEGVLGGAVAPAAAAAGEDAAAPKAALSLASLRASSGASIVLDSDSTRLVAWGAQAQVSAVAAAVGAASSDLSARHGDLPISHWMGPAIVGKKGAGIVAIEAALPAGCVVKAFFDSEEARGAGAGGPPSHALHRGHGAALPHALASGEAPHVSVTAPTPEALATALAHLRTVIAGHAKQRVYLSIPSVAFGAIIGKGGSIIKKLQVRRGRGVWQRLLLEK